MAVSWDVIRTERRALIEYLETLTPEQWATPSLCQGWRVQDVAAHLAAAPSVTPGPLLADAVVHALDARRPLGGHRAIPPEAFGPAADFCANTGKALLLLLSGRRPLPGELRGEGVSRLGAAA
jgi:hypothetical protein